MVDRNFEDDEPRRGYTFHRIFRRVVGLLRYCADNFCSCRVFVSFFILICSMALLRMWRNNSGSEGSDRNILRNSTDSLTNLADFEEGTLVRRRNSNNADALARLLDGDVNSFICDSVNITTLMSIFDDGIPRECVHSDAAVSSETKCLQCAIDKLKELTEQNAGELRSYDRLPTIHPRPDERTCLLSRDHKDACNSISSENLQDKYKNRSVENSESGAAGISKPNIDIVDERQNNTWRDIPVVSHDSFDGLYVNEATIRGLDCDNGIFHDVPYLDNIGLEINAPPLQDAERAANNAPQDLGLQAVAPTLLGMTGSHDATLRDIRRPQDPIQTYHEVLSRICSLINLPYQNQCSNASNVGNLENPSDKRYETEGPTPVTGAIPKNRNAGRPAMQPESPAKEQGQEESPSRATGAIPKNWEVIRKLRKDAKTGGQSRSVEAHSSSSRSISHPTNTDSVMTNSYVGAIPRNLDNVQTNDGQSWTSDLNYWSFEMPLISRVTDHESTTSQGRRRHYAGNILRAAGDLNPRLIMVPDEVSKDDDEAVVEYSGEIINTDDIVVEDEGNNADTVIEGIGEIIYSDENETLV